MPSVADGAMPVLVVASWFPSVDDSTRGRFIADQVTALAAGGRVAPRVVSFETIMLSGERPERQSQAAAIESFAPTTAGDERTISRRGIHGPDGIPLARLPVAAGWPGIASEYPAERRRAALRGLPDAALAAARVVHAHTGFPDGAASIELAGRLAAPLVITEHASFLAAILADPPRRREYEAAVAAAARIVTVSHTLGKELVAALPAVAAKLVVIPTAVDVDAFRAESADARRDDELLYVGYRLGSKGMAVLLRAFRDVRAERPNATLRLIGRSVDEASEQSWRDLARELGVADAVTFDPPALRSGVADAMARASVLVHASPRETFGMTAVEALASGTPVVAADSGGVTATLASDPRLGEIVARDEPAALAEAVLRTLARRSDFDPAYLRASAVSRFGAESVARRLADLYDEILRATPDPLHAGAATWPAPIGPSPARRTLIVGFTTARTERILSAMPAAALADARVLSARADTVGPLPLPDDRVTVVDLEAAYRHDLGLESGARRARSMRARLVRAARDPYGVIRRRLIRRHRAAYRLESARAALSSAIAALTPHDVATLDVVAVDGIDFLVVSRVPAAAARLAPGGLRWFADQYASRVEEAPHAPAEPAIQ